LTEHTGKELQLTRLYPRISKRNGGSSPNHATDTVAAPDLFNVITYFRARGDSYALIANIGFWLGDDRSRVLTAKGLRLWYEGELDRRLAKKATKRRPSARS
jgi:hypothetical protein